MFSCCCQRSKKLIKLSRTDPYVYSMSFINPKVLTIRLNVVISKMISVTQTTFIPGHFILDGVLIVLKLDFEKAYDKVN